MEERFLSENYCHVLGLLVQQYWSSLIQGTVCIGLLSVRDSVRAGARWYVGY